MLEKLFILGTGNIFRKGMFGFVTDIYTTVGKVYDLLLTIKDKTGDRTLYDSLYSISNIIYILMGIFMLFRITISFLNMVIDPDKISDKSAGVSSIIKRTFISILLLIAFEPESFVFDYLSRVQDAILSSDGLLNNITAEIGSSNVRISDTVIDNVSAIDNISYECIYVHKNAISEELTNSVSGNSTYSVNVYDYDEIVKITISNYGLGNDIQTPNNSSTGWNVKVNSGYLTDNSGNIWNLTNNISNKNFTIKKSLISSTFSKSSCPSYIAPVSNTEIRFLKTYNTNTNDESYINVSSVNEIASFIAKDSKNTESNYSSNTTSSYSVGNEDAINGYKETGSSILSSSSLTFAQTLLRCFIEENSSADEGVTEKLDNLLVDESYNNDVYDIATSNNPEISIDYFLSLIVGIFVIVYLIYICIELIIRNFKLVILEVLAPIPIISYIDPKDKIFNNWLKMYLTTYADLFIKLFCITIGLSLLDSVFSAYASASGFEKLLFIIGIFVFIKAIPSIINKIFNIDLGNNSFKEIMKTMKTGVALGAAGVGGAIGLGVGAATGTGFGRVTGAASGMLMGFGAGYKKKVFDGGKNIAVKNARINDAKKDGLNFWQRTGAGIAATVGYSPKMKLDNKIKDYTDNKKMLDDWRKNKDNVEAMANKNNTLTDLSNKVTNGELSQEEFKDIRNKYINWMTAQDENGSYTAGTAGHETFDFSYTDLKTGEQISGPTIKYKDSDASKVQHAFENLQGVYSENSSLRTELGRNIVDSKGNITSQGIEFVDGIHTYDEFLKSEAHATKRSNKHDETITKMQASDEYRQAVAFDDYSKKNK